MNQVRRLAFVAVAALAIVVVAGCSSDSKTTSSTSSSSSSSSSSAGGGLTVASSSGGPGVAVTVSDTKGTDGPMTLVASPDNAKSGDVTFTVKNTGTIDHEVVVLKTDTPFDQLKVGESEADKVDESTSVGETGDPALKPGETRSFTLTGLAAGNYVLVCNIAKHYGLGMRLAFKVS
jgi:uncharacterized cupredoxin-like copper-binding protein